MPKLGKPDGINPFRDVTMGSPSSSPRRTIGTVEGVRDEVEFVDPKEHNTLGKDGFLKLLTHQLSNQDPLKPMDQKQFAADLAQFSQLEQLTALNSQFEKMGAARGGENKFYGASFLGKDIVTQGNILDYDGKSDVSEIAFFLPEDAQELTVKIFDERNQMVGRIDKGSTPKGDHRLVWDGRMLDGSRATAGSYSFGVEAVDIQARRFSARTKTSGTVTGISFDKGATVLTVDNQRQVFLKDVIGLKMPEIQDKTPHSVNISQLKRDDASSYSKDQDGSMH